MVVACPKESLWRKLCQAIGRPELAGDPRFADFAARRVNRDELVPILTEVFRTRATADWVSTLSSAGVPCSPIRSVAEALEDPQVAARGGVVGVDHPILGEVRHVASPFRLSGFAPESKGRLLRESR